MNNDTVIKLEGVSKKFIRSLRCSMVYGMRDVARNVVGIPSKTETLRPEEFWALDSISFEVKKGETLGIIGSNGAGKTTLLKLLNGILWPDKGKITIKGRVAALIEVGAGFHPLLTGRENIYINGAILGMSKKEIDRKFDDIVAFADIGDFLDMPVKNYSSGMYVRLGFAIAVHCELDIMLVDEVLAVGDLNFRRKCQEHMRYLMSKGTAVVFVSHYMPHVQGLCQGTLWLDQGRVVAEGRPAEVIARYTDALNQQAKSVRSWDCGSSRFGTGEVVFESVEVMDSKAQPTKLIRTGEPLHIRIHYRVEKPVDEALFRIWIQDVATGVIVTFADSRMGGVPTRLAQEGTVECVFEPALLRPRQYSVFVGVCGTDYLVPYDRWGDAATFAVSSEGLEEDVTFIHGQPDLVALPYRIWHEPGGTG